MGDAFRNQVQDTGHDRRLSDLQLIADNGIQTLHYPVIWEVTRIGFGTMSS